MREPLSGFLDLLVLDPTAVTSQTDMLKACKEWAKGKVDKRVTHEQISVFLSNATDGKVVHGWEGGSRRVYKGVRIKA